MRRICGCIRWGLQFLSNRIRQSYRKNVIWKMIVRTRHPSPGIYIYLQKAKLKKVCWTSPRPGSIFGNSLGPNYVGNVVHCLRLNGRQIKTKTMRRAFWENAPIVLCIGHRNALILFFMNLAFRWDQCDQIGRFLKVLGNKISSKWSPNDCQLFGLFRKTSLLCKNCILYF